MVTVKNGDDYTSIKLYKHYTTYWNILVERTYIPIKNERIQYPALSHFKYICGYSPTHKYILLYYRKIDKRYSTTKFDNIIHVKIHNKNFSLYKKFRLCYLQNIKIFIF